MKNESDLWPDQQRLPVNLCDFLPELFFEMDTRVHVDHMYPDKWMSNIKVCLQFVSTMHNDSDHSSLIFYHLWFPFFLFLLWLGSSYLYLLRFASLLCPWSWNDYEIMKPSLPSAQKDPGSQAWFRSQVKINKMNFNLSSSHSARIPLAEFDWKFLFI